MANPSVGLDGSFDAFPILAPYGNLLANKDMALPLENTAKMLDKAGDVSSLNNEATIHIVEVKRLVHMPGVIK